MPKDAKYPEFEDEKDRAKTFRNWPHDKPDGRSVAEAGFFYGGTGDSAKCFFCGLSLHLWEPDDVPLSEHAVHGSSCGWLRSKVKRCLVSKMNFVSEFGFDGDVIEAVVGDLLEKKGDVFSLTISDLVERAIDFEKREVSKKADGNDEHSKHADLVALISDLRLEDEAKATREEVREPVDDSPKKRDERRDDQDDESKSLSELLKELENLKDEMSCKVCLDGAANVLLTPCNHLVCCYECSIRLRSCPICRAKVGKVVHVYHS